MKMVRSHRDKKKIQVAKENAVKEQQKLILESRRKREFFRFENQDLIEYDCTRYRGREVRLTAEEKRANEAFQCTA